MVLKMDNRINIEQEMVSIKECLQKGESLDERKMTMLFFFSFLQEEGKGEFGNFPKDSE